MPPHEVTVDLSWFIGTIATLAATVGILARVVYSLQTARLRDAQERGQLVRDVVDASTRALNTNSAALEALTRAVVKRRKPGAQ